MTTRRQFVHGLGVFALSGLTARVAAACAAVASGGGRLSARPHTPRRTIAPGLVSLGLVTDRDTQLYVPSSYRADRQTALIVGLHGAGQSSDVIMRILRDSAEAHGHLLLAPNSRDMTWDVVHGLFGDDEKLLDAALEWCFDRCNVDPSRVVMAGFSDGATVALSLGLINGDLFRRIAAFSPGFIVGEERHGKPAIFVSHGTRDQILPIDRTSRQIVPMLKAKGYAVNFREFDGPHRVPPEVVEDMMAWLARPS